MDGWLARQKESHTHTGKQWIVWLERWMDRGVRKRMKNKHTEERVLRGSVVDELPITYITAAVLGPDLRNRI